MTLSVILSCGRLICPHSPISRKNGAKVNKFTLGSGKYEADIENSDYGDNLEINNAERKAYRYIVSEWVDAEDDENQ